MQKKQSGLAARYQKSYDTKDAGGVGKSAFDWKKAGKEITYFKVKEGKNRINIIPYEIATKQHPLVKSGDAKVGDMDYVMDAYIHKSVGPSQSDVICLKKMVGKPCPVCEAADEFKNSGKEKEFKELKPSRRCIYNIIDVKAPDKGLQIFETSQYLFEKELIEAQRGESEGGDLIDFASPEDGKVVVFRAETDSFGGHEFFKFKGFQFIDREDALEDDVVKEAISLDSLLIIPTYEEVKAILYGDDEEEDDEEEEKPSKGKKASKNDDDDDEEEAPKKPSKKPAKEEDDEEEEAPKKPSKPSKPAKPSDDDDEEEPPKKPAKAPAKPPKEEDDEEPPAKKPTKEAAAAKGECPHGHTFGKDCDDTPDCDDCKVWDKCVKAQK